MAYRENQIYLTGGNQKFRNLIFIYARRIHFDMRSNAYGENQIIEIYFILQREKRNERKVIF